MSSTKVSALPPLPDGSWLVLFSPGALGTLSGDVIANFAPCNKREKICEHHPLTRPRDSVTSAGSHKQTDRFLEVLRTLDVLSPRGESGPFLLDRGQPTPFAIALVLPVQARPKKCLVFSHRFLNLKTIGFSRVRWFRQKIKEEERNREFERRSLELSCTCELRLGSKRDHNWLQSMAKIV